LSEVLKLNNLIKRHKSRVFRVLELKRRNESDGLYESSWQDLSDDVKKWGSITSELDVTRLARLKFGNMKVTFANNAGKYNPEDDPASFWSGYLPQQRSLVRVKAGFYNDTLSADGIWSTQYFPAKDEPKWDNNNNWDAVDSIWDNQTVAFTGIVSGDIFTNDKNEVTFSIAPITQVFRDYAARNITPDYTTTGITAQTFVEAVRDHQDINGNYVFRPFFGDTSSNWLIGTTTSIYPNLNTTTAEDLLDANVWDVMQKLAEAESFVCYTNKSGRFVFKDKNDITTTSYEFHGLNSDNTEYGHTIKNIKRYGKKVSKLYTRVSIQHNSDSTQTSYEIKEATLTVSPQSSAWLYGQRSLNISNNFIDATVAESIATAIFNEVSALKYEIEFSTSFIAHLDVLDQVKLTYISGEFQYGSLWDINNWCGSTIAAGNLDLFWSDVDGDAVDLQGAEFKLLSYNINLDTLETTFVAREV
jgi:hypothetical protein